MSHHMFFHKPSPHVLQWATMHVLQWAATCSSKSHHISLKRS
jgi:hypothetical protein